MVKVISISDEIYADLSQIKKGKSFTERRRKAERAQLQESLLHLSDSMVIFDVSLMVDESQRQTMER